MFKDSGKPCLANFFVHYGDQVYQFRNIEQAFEIIGLLKKQHIYDEYRDKLWHQKYLEKQKKRKEREDAKKLKAIASEAA